MRGIGDGGLSAVRGWLWRRRILREQPCGTIRQSDDIRGGGRTERLRYRSSRGELRGRRQLPGICKARMAGGCTRYRERRREGHTRLVIVRRHGNMGTLLRDLL